MLLDPEEYSKLEIDVQNTLSREEKYPKPRYSSIKKKNATFSFFVCILKKDLSSLLSSSFFKALHPYHTRQKVK